jgi:hypothetical protein
LAALALGFAQSARGASSDFDSSKMSFSQILEDWELWSRSYYNPTHFEMRGGAFGTILGPQKDGVGVNGELVLPKMFTTVGFTDILIPRLDLGGTASVTGKTSYAYADMLWTLNYTNHIFGEFAFGIAANDGPSSQLGCSEMFLLGANFGYRFDTHWSAMLSFQHASNGEPRFSTCSHNDGLNNLGLRFGYDF